MDGARGEQGIIYIYHINILGPVGLDEARDWQGIIYTVRNFKFSSHKICWSTGIIAYVGRGGG